MKEQQTNGKEVIVVDHIYRDDYEEYIGKTVKVTGNVRLSDLGLTKIPINFTEVGGDFYCYNNQLTSLEGCPKYVGGSFYCSHNRLTSLVGSPKEVGESFWCSHNELTSLKGAPEKVGEHFFSINNPLKSLEGGSKEVGGDLKITTYSF